MQFVMPGNPQKEKPRDTLGRFYGKYEHEDEDAALPQQPRKPVASEFRYYRPSGDEPINWAEVFAGNTAD